MHFAAKGGDLGFVMGNCCLEKFMTRIVSLHILSLFLLLSLITKTSLCIVTLTADFVFGDSLVEVGNNNYFFTLSKANYPPNGIDFGEPTGRFTNGRTIGDIIDQKLGLTDFVPPFLAKNTTGEIVLKGVNYASGAGGIFDRTGYAFIGRISFDAQLTNFASTKNYIIEMIGESKAMELLQNALFSVTLGTNDFVNNYLLPFVSKPSEEPNQIPVPPEVFVAFMISRYKIQLTRLYNMGARKIVVANVGPIGCIPFVKEFVLPGVDGCAALPNQLAQFYNDQLRVLILELRSSLNGSEFVYADVFRTLYDIIQNYASYGFQNSSFACCYVAGIYGGLIPCNPISKVCEDRSKFVFWDPYHPTEAANLIIANRMLDGGTDDIWPINIRQLISLSSS